MAQSENTHKHILLRITSVYVYFLFMIFEENLGHGKYSSNILLRNRRPRILTQKLYSIYRGTNLRHHQDNVYL